MSRIADIRALVYRAPIEQPVVTSFGRMLDRPMVLVRIEDDEGAIGWGEVWCNFPACGAEHRARILASVVAPLLIGASAEEPGALFEATTRRTRILALQAGEPGPIAQVLAGIDIALWDLLAKRRGVPLWRLLGGTDGRIAVYASGINPDAPEHVAGRKHAAGFRALKLKVGFGTDRDLDNLRAMRAAVGPGCVLMADANQGWDAESACAMLDRLRALELRWVEEPVAADTPWPRWRELAACGVPLAAGENIADAAAFESALEAGVLAVVQPDLAKWGGFSGCLAVARRILAAGRSFCPHYLGGGIGLLASGHLLAAAGGGGMLEVDANENALRSRVAGLFDAPEDGHCVLPDSPGLGVPSDLETTLQEFRVA